MGGSMEEMFIQTDEQRAILESVKRFVADVVTPKAPALDAMTDPAAGYSENRSSRRCRRHPHHDVIREVWRPRHRLPHLCVPNIRFSMDAENRRGKFAT